MSGVAIKLDRLPHGEGLDLPHYRTDGAAGLDLAAAVADDAPVEIPAGAWRTIPTGLILAIPAGYEGQVRPRSGLARDHGVTVLNAPGTIDSDYRGELQVLLVNLGPAPFSVTRGMRIAQLVIAPVVRADVQLTETLEPTSRGAGGFGSTGAGR